MLEINTYVRNLHTGDEGTITGYDGDGWYLVQLWADNEIYPIPAESLVRGDEFFGTVPIEKLAVKKPSTVAKQPRGIVQMTTARGTKTVYDDTPPYTPPAKGTPADGGLFVVFDYDETTSKYYVYLVNDTSTGFTPQFRITKMVAIGGVNSVVNIAEYHGILPMHEFYAVGEMSNADLSDHLSIHLAIPAMQVTFEQALKPQNLFKRIVGEGSTFTTLFQHTDRTCYALPIPLKAKPAASSSTDNDTALPHHAAKANTHKNPPPRAAFIPSRDINELANFSTEIDLHIEKLVARPKDMLEFEMLEKQLRVFDDYVTRAVMLGVSRVYIIHGKGKGRLRDEIHRRLRENMFIISFNDNYHPKYGNGATEVVIK